jgi:hypothetical protein
VLLTELPFDWRRVEVVLKWCLSELKVGHFYSQLVSLFSGILWRVGLEDCLNLLKDDDPREYLRSNGRLSNSYEGNAVWLPIHNVIVDSILLYRFEITSPLRSFGRLVHYDIATLTEACQ